MVAQEVSLDKSGQEIQWSNQQVPPPITLENSVTTPQINQPNLMKAKMDAGGLAVGMIVRLMRNVEIAAIAKSAGFDCLYIDLEHCSFSLETVSQICMTATALGVTPLVRVAGHDAATISRTLESGAQGVIIPHLDTGNRSGRRRALSTSRQPVPFGAKSAYPFPRWPCGRDHAAD
jgi:2-keto-3-deoxy-L-rhamnonate aldolase RhmA